MCIRDRQPVFGGKQRTFVVACKPQPAGTTTGAGAKLSTWRQRLENPGTVTPTVGSFLGRSGHYFLQRPQGEKAIFAADAPSPTITHAHIMGRRPPMDDYHAHPEDAGAVDTAEDLQWSDYVKLTTTHDGFRLPDTVRRSAAAWALEEFALPPMLWEVFLAEVVSGVVRLNTDTRNSVADDLRR